MILIKPKPFGEAEYIISADYRSHFEEMRDSSVAISTAQRRPFLSSISFGRCKRNGQNRVKGVEHPLKHVRLSDKPDFKGEAFDFIA